MIAFEAFEFDMLLKLQPRFFLQVNDLSLRHGHLFQSAWCPSFHVTPVATNEYAAARDAGTLPEGGKGSKPSNTYRNGRGPKDEPVCGETGAPYRMAGPLWTGPLHDLDAVNEAIASLEAARDNGGVDPSGGSPLFPLHTANTLHGLLVSASEELNDVPLYYQLPSLCSQVNSSTIPKDKFWAALVNAGYRVSGYHKDPTAVKTDAPNHVVWDVVRAWCKEHPPAKRKESKKHGKGKQQQREQQDGADKRPAVDVASKILSNEVRTEVDFTIPESFGQKKKATRYAMNPEANWGPKKAASGRNKRKADGPSGAEQDKSKESKLI